MDLLGFNFVFLLVSDGFKLLFVMFLGWFGFWIRTCTDLDLRLNLVFILGFSFGFIFEA